MAVGVVFGLAGVALCIWRGCQRRIARVRLWAADNRKLVRLIESQLTTAAVTIQTGILINENHEAAGGADPPYETKQSNSPLPLSLSHSLCISARFFLRT